MKQLNLFEFLDEDKLVEMLSVGMNEISFDLPTKEKKAVNRSLRRKVSRKIVDIDKIFKALKDDLNAYYLSQLDLRTVNLKEDDEYMDVILREVNKTFFKKIDIESNLANISEMLSDDFISVTLQPGDIRFKKLMKSTPIDIVVCEKGNVESKESYVTGSNFKASGKNFVPYYIRGEKEKTQRTAVKIDGFLPLLLLLKEARRFFSNPINISFIEHEIEAFLKGKMKITLPMHYKYRIEKIYSKMLNDVGIDVEYGEVCNVELDKFDLYLGYLSLREEGIEQINIKNVVSLSKLIKPLGAAGAFACRHVSKHYFNAVKQINFYEYTQKKSSEDYAATYEVKKNIPDVLLKMMDNSKLKKYFASVEYDELLDRTRIIDFEKEVIKYVELMGLPIPEDIHFKVRRLGKYKASGLFFPFQRVLALDIDDSGAYVHEAWHLFDYYLKKDLIIGKRLSMMKEFEKIKDAYIKLVSEKVDALDNSDLVKVRHNGSGKYNKSYYFDSAEIFARCGEIYSKQHLGDYSLLVGELDGVYYPDDAFLLEKINMYFDKLLEEGKNVAIIKS